MEDTGLLRCPWKLTAPYPDEAGSSSICTLPQLWPPAPAQVWSQQGKVYALDSLEPWAVMDLP